MFQIRQVKLGVIETDDLEIFSIFAQQRGAEPPARADNDIFHVVAAAVTGGRRRSADEDIGSYNSQASNSSRKTQYLPARSSSGCHHDGLSMYHWIVSPRPSSKSLRGFHFSSRCANEESIA